MPFTFFRWISSTLRDAAWAPLTVFACYLIAAQGFDAYHFVPWLDIPTHFLGGMAAAHFFRTAALHLERLVGRIPGPVQIILAFGLTAVSAVIWEFYEFTSDLLMGTQMNLGVADTLGDLFVGMLGGAFMLQAGLAFRQIEVLRKAERSA